MILGVILAVFCLPFCGAWTAPINDDVYYGGAQPISFYGASEQVTYTEKQILSDISTANGAPDYYPINNLSNACGAAAGATILGFYDKYIDIIKNWNSYLPNGKYKPQDSVYVTKIIEDLFVEMKTNVTQSGVTENDFKTGLRNYIQSLGHNVNYEYLGTGNNLNFTSMRSAFSNNKVVVFFIKPDNVYTITGNSNSDLITTTNISANHIMVAHGYYEIRYILSSGTRTESYIKVSSCLNIAGQQYYKVAASLVSAYTVDIQ